MALEKPLAQRDAAQQFQSPSGAIRRQKWTAPAAASTTAVHAAVNSNAVITTGITNPDKPRNVTIVGAGSGHAATGNVVINGTDIRGNAISETLALNSNTTVAGNKAFATVTSIDMTGVSGNDANDTVAVGTGVKLGLDRNLLDQSVLDGYADGVREATFPTVAASGTVATASISSNTVSFNTAPNGTHNFSVYFATTDITEASGTTA